MDSKTILLTGATGFLGSHLLEAFLQNGYQVVILKRTTSNLRRIVALIQRCKIYDVDVTPLELAFSEQKINYVVHTACHYGRNNDSLSDVMKTNLLFGLRLLDASVKFNIDTFFNTDTLLPKNLNGYSLSKKQFVEWLNYSSNEVQVVNMRLEHMYGPKDDTRKFAPWILSQLRQNVHEIKLTPGEQKRDFIHVYDVVSAYLKTLDSCIHLGNFNQFDVGTGSYVKLKSFVTQLKQVYEEELGEKVCTHLNFGAVPYREGEMMSVKVNNSALKQLGWTHKITLSNGLKTIID